MVVKTVITVRSGDPISDETLEKIKTIFQESQCPNESLQNSVKDFSSFDGDRTVQLREGSAHIRTIEIYSASQ